MCSWYHKQRYGSAGELAWLLGVRKEKALSRTPREV
jgi:hypothetical protein